MLSGVVILKPERHADARGTLAEVVRASQSPWPLAQVYVVWIPPGETRGMHYHERKREWFAVLQGVCQLALRDVDTGEGMDLSVGPETDAPVVGIPPRVWHSFKNTSGETAIILAIPSEEYDPKDEDTIRSDKVEYFDG